MTQVLTIDIDISQGIEQLNSDIAAKEQEFYDCNKKITLNDIILIVFVELASLALPYTSSDEVLKDARSRILYNTTLKRAALKVNLIQNQVGKDTIKSYIRDFLKIWKTALLNIDYNDINEHITDAVSIISDLVNDARSNLCEVIDVSQIKLENDELKHKLEAADKTTAELSKKIEEMQELTTQIEVIKSAQEKIGADKAKLEEKSQQIADQLAKTKLANELNGIIFSLQSNVLQSELEKENQSNTGNKKTIEKLEGKLSILEAQNKESLKKNMEDTEEKEKLLKKLEQENNQLVQDLANGKSEIRELAYRAQEQEGKLDKLTKKNEESMKEIMESKNKLETDLFKAQEDAETAKKDAEKELKSKELSEDQVLSLKKDLETAQTELSQLKALSSVVETTKTDAEKQLDELTQKIGMANHENTVLKQLGNECTETVRSLEEELENVKKADISKYNKIIQLNDQSHKLFDQDYLNKKTIDDNYKYIAELEKGKEALTEEVNSANTVLKQLGNECTETVRSLEEELKSSKLLNADTSKLNTELNNLKEEVTKAKNAKELAETELNLTQKEKQSSEIINSCERDEVELLKVIDYIQDLLFYRNQQDTKLGEVGTIINKYTALDKDADADNVANKISEIRKQITNIKVDDVDGKKIIGFIVEILDIASSISIVKNTTLKNTTKTPININKVYGEIQNIITRIENVNNGVVDAIQEKRAEQETKFKDISLVAEIAKNEFTKLQDKYTILENEYKKIKKISDLQFDKDPPTIPRPAPSPPPTIPSPAPSPPPTISRTDIEKLVDLISGTITNTLDNYKTVRTYAFGQYNISEYENNKAISNITKYGTSLNTFNKKQDKNEILLDIWNLFETVNIELESLKVRVYKLPKYPNPQEYQKLYSSGNIETDLSNINKRIITIFYTKYTQFQELYKNQSSSSIIYNNSEYYNAILNYLNKEYNLLENTTNPNIKLVWNTFETINFYLEQFRSQVYYIPYQASYPEPMENMRTNSQFTGGGGSIRYMEFQKLSNNNILYIVWVLVAFITLALSVFVTQVVMQRLEKKEYKHPIDKSVTFSLILTFVYSCIFVLHSLLGQSTCLLAVSLSVCAVSGMSLYMAHVFSVY